MQHSNTLFFLGVIIPVDHSQNNNHPITIYFFREYTKSITKKTAELPIILLFLRYFFGKSRQRLQLRTCFYKCLACIVGGVFLKVFDETTC